MAGNVDLAAIFHNLEACKTTAATSPAVEPHTLAELFPDCIVVCNESSATVELKIRSLMEKLDDSLKNGTTRSSILLFPSRGNQNQLYVPEHELFVLKRARPTRSYLSEKAAKDKVSCTLEILKLILTLLSRKRHLTKRDVYYKTAKKFGNQEYSDAILDDICCIFECTRSSLNIKGCEKGVVVGNLMYRVEGVKVDCSKGAQVISIPAYIGRVTDMQSDALFILVVEKYATFDQLKEEKFYERFPCIIVTGKGQPDVGTRQFLRKMKMELKLPVFALVDCDPHGVLIFCVYRYGSKNMSYDSANLATPDIKWLGLRPSDLDKLKIPKDERLQMTAADIKCGQALLEEDFMKGNPEWVEELKLMMNSNKKADIQALGSLDIQYITETYLPRKLQEMDWL